MRLFHKVLPERVNSETLKNIAEHGLIPRLPSEYRMSLPAYLQEAPLVWLAEKMNTLDGKIYSVDCSKLEIMKLHKLDWEDVDWWVYEGTIPPSQFITQRSIDFT